MRLLCRRLACRLDESVFRFPSNLTQHLQRQANAEAGVAGLAMNSSHHFPSRFAAAGLPVVVAQGPLFGGRGAFGKEDTEAAFDALRQAGFTEASTVWQLFDDHIVFARR